MATEIGKVVSDFLMAHFETIMDYDFTAEMEEDLDRIARGEKQWRKVVKDFYSPLEKKIDAVKTTADRVKIPVESTGEKCPDCGDTDGGEIVIRTGRFGKFKSCSRFPECKFTQNIVETVEGVNCPLCGEGQVVVKNSRWGKSFFGCSRYPDCNWASWQKPAPGFRLSKEEWAEMQAAREKRKLEKQAKFEKKETKPKKAAAPKKKKTAKKK